MASSKKKPKIKVQAKLPERKFGWIDNRKIFNGEEFEIDESAFSHKWMVKLKKKPGPKKQAKPEGEDEGDNDDDNDVSGSEEGN